MLVPLSGNVSAQEDMIEWREYNFGMEKAGNEKIPVMLDFYTEWCSYCKIMDEKTYTDPDVISKSHSFVAIKVEAEKESEVSKNYEIPGYPTIFFLMPDGSIISKVVGYTEVEPFLEEMDNALKFFNENKDSSKLGGSVDEKETDDDHSNPVGLYFIVGFVAIFVIMVVVISRIKEK